MNSLQKLIKWFWRIFQRPEPEIKPYIIKSWSSPWGDLFLLRRDTKGAVKNATFRFVPAIGLRPGSLLLTCDRFRPSRDATGKISGGNLLAIRDGTPTAGHPSPTHRLTLTLVEQTANQAGMVQTRILWSYPVDFVGSKVLGRKSQLSVLGWEPEHIEALDLEDRAAMLITGAIASELLQKNWKKIDFENLIDVAARKEVGSNHEILRCPSLQIFKN